MAAGPWHLRAIGGAELSRGNERLVLERKTAALLTYLALEGQGAKHALAGILWPQTSDEAARGNMRQLLRRLRVATGDELVEGQDTLRLSGRVEADVRTVMEAAASDRFGDLLAYRGILLAGIEFDDCEELSAWLGRAREQLAAIRTRACSREVQRLVRDADWRVAQERIDQWIELDPLSEAPWRERIRVRQASGDRTGALEAFDRLRELLRRELGVEPEPETVQLVRQVERGQVVSKAATVASRLPVGVLHPPVLAGREKEWQALEDGWNAGQFLLITGEAGVGKSRLARDFAASKGRYILFEGRPGDTSVPFASMTRALRKMLAENGAPEVPEWIRRELTRLMPELLQPGEAPPPMISGADKLRFYDAQGELLIRGSQGCACWVIDDIQFYDAGSVELSEYLIAKHFPFGQPGGPPRFIDTFRKGELAESTQKAAEAMMEAGLVRMVEVEPLSEGAVSKLLAGLELPGAAELSREIARYTGGNPLFVVETVKHLLETGGLARAWPGDFPPPGKVAALVQRRIERLPRLALQLTQVAALAGTEFDVQVAAKVLDVPLLEVAAAHAQAEAALILCGNRFTHDLLFEAVRASIPATLKAALHRRLGEVLERARAPAMHVAQHWLAAGESLRAVPLLFQAARLEEGALRFGEAAGHYLQAADVLDRQGKKTDAARMRDEAARCRAAGS